MFRMNRILAIAMALTAIACSRPAFAEGSTSAGTQHRPFGIGIVLGEPSGFTGKLFFDGNNAMQLHVGYGIGHRGRLVLALDYLFHIRNVLPRPNNAGRFEPYLGLGLRLGVRDHDPLLGVRIPAGLALLFEAFPVELFIEVAVGIGLIPSTAIIVDGGLGARFYF